MPIYEYRCCRCGRLNTILVQRASDDQGLECTECGSTELTRMMSTFRIGKGSSYMRKGVYEDILTDNQLVKGLERGEPRALAEWNRRMGQEDVGKTSPEYEEMLGRLDAGESVGQAVGEAPSRSAGTGGEEK